MLGWMLTTITAMGELERMTQFKDKSQGKETIGTGLFVYPSLQAADILLYNANLVPVGADQKQHLELTRDLAQRFNQRFGNTFVIPEGHFTEVGARVMSLIEATKKMSKSDPNPNAYISLLDSPELIRKKISRATTDSGLEIRFDRENKPEISNLLEILSAFTAESIPGLETRYEGKGYGALKKDVAEAIVSKLQPIQEEYQRIRTSGEIKPILQQGAEKARQVADATLLSAMERMGFLAL
jgi:tryptophanyl-tRNA synthetase